MSAQPFRRMFEAAHGASVVVNSRYGAFRLQRNTPMARLPFDPCRPVHRPMALRKLDLLAMSLSKGTR